MKIDSSEIASLIKAQIKGYEQELKEDDVGTVISVGDGIALCYGLNNAMLGELLIFPHDVYGMVMNLDTEDVGCVLLGSDYEILEGDTVKGGQLLMRIALIPLISGISYEMLMYAASHDNTLARVLSSPGLLMQRLTTREPDSAMAEVAIQAVEAVFDWREYLGKNDQCQTAGSNGDSETEGGRC